jgi:hypothetical protein
MTISIFYTDGTTSSNITTTQTLDQIVTSLNSDEKFVNIGGIIVKPVMVSTVKEVTV